MGRTLLIRERRIGGQPGIPAYRAAWVSLEQAARAAGANAWVFQAVGQPLVFIEFVEWHAEEAGAPGGVMLNAAVELAHATLEQIAPATPRGTWSEWKAE